MPMLITKVEKEAPELAATYQATGKLLIKKGVRPGKDQAAVMIYDDHSGSTEDRDSNQHLYTRRVPAYGDVSEMQHVTNFGIAGGLFFDDDGKIPVNIFDTRVIELGEAQVHNYKKVLERHSRYNYGGTSYLCVFRHVLQSLGYDDLNLGRSGSPLSVKASAAYPTYVQINTDGEPMSDHEYEIFEMLVRMSQLPIFWQFVGVGSHNFKLLKKLDTLEGRLIDNAGFFDLKDPRASTVEGFTELMLGEFAGSFYPEGRKVGLITSSAS